MSPIARPNGRTSGASPGFVSSSYAVDPDTGEEEVVVVGKDSTRYYEYIDPAVHNGFLYFYSVTATDHELEIIPG